MQIKVLHKQGKSLRAIPCEPECSTDILRKHVQPGHQPVYHERLKAQMKTPEKKVHLRPLLPHKNKNI